MAMKMHEGSFCLEYQFSEMRLDRNFDIEEIVTNIHDYVATLPLVERDVTHVHFWPHYKNPKKVILVFATEIAKDIMKQRGLNIYGCAITLDEPGKGLVHVEVHGVPYSLPNLSLIHI